MKTWHVILFFQSLAVTIHGLEYEVRSNEVVEVEVVFPKKGNPLNTVPTTPEEREKSARLVSFLDRLLNRNQGGSSSTGGASTSSNTNNNVGTATTPRRTSGLGSLLFVPDVSKGVDTILGGVATGNLEQIISGSFIFTPNRVQTVANSVINRVFGGQSIATLPNSNTNSQNNVPNNNNNGNTNNNNPGSLASAVNAINQNQIPASPNGDNRQNNNNNNPNNNNNNPGIIQGVINGVLGNFLGSLGK